MKKIYAIILSGTFALALSACGRAASDTTETEEESSSYAEEEDGFYLGCYPQTRVEADEKNGLTGYSFDSATWTSYRYYMDRVASDYMFYYDLDTDKDGAYDYRGVYFTEYRSGYAYFNSPSYQEDNGYEKNTIYWFRYDPIRWDILTEQDGRKLIAAHLILDSQEYNYTGGEILDDVKNNYKLSNIRKWLNDVFYNTAFSMADKSAILTTVIDNSIASTGYTACDYICEDTEDNVFLLSYHEANVYDGFRENDPTVKLKVTEYAKSQGLYAKVGLNMDMIKDTADWWTRSPWNDAEFAARGFSNGGLPIAPDVRFTYVGVRPACWIKA